MMAVEIKTQPVFSAGSPRLFFEGQYSSFVHRRNYDVTPDGQHFLMFKSADPAATQINVVLNWFSELQQRVPVK